MDKARICRELAEKLGHVEDAGPDCHQCGETHGKRSPDYFASAEDSERLLVAMRQEGIVVRYLPHPINLWACYRWTGDYDHKPEVSLTNVPASMVSAASDLRVAVVFAACKWQSVEI